MRTGSIALGAYVPGRALDYAGRRHADIIPVTVEPDRHVQIFRAHEVDAVVTYEPNRSRLLDEGGRLLSGGPDGLPSGAARLAALMVGHRLIHAVPRLEPLADGSVLARIPLAAAGND